jgi:SAM-dependent MidA family methyltransferase
MDGAAPVLAAIEEALQRRDSVSFEELMELALYHPRGGLYRRSCPPGGREGLYSTCAHIDPALGIAVARWLELGWRETLGSPRRWHAIEVGGGDGSLAVSVLDALPRTLRSRLTYLMVEQGEAALSRQRERLSTRVRWMPSMKQALRSCRGMALIFSNELVDAFPAAALVRCGGRWLEVHLVERSGRLVEDPRPHPDWDQGSDLFSVNSLTSVPDGARAEAHRTYWHWLGSWCGYWTRGAMLTIDYGGECDELYGRGGGGTLRAYFSHLRFDDHEELTRRLGLQDLTCDVSFTDLRRWGERLGWATVATMTQRELLERFTDLSGEPDRASLAFIARPGGAGTCFRALWQTCGERAAPQGPGEGLPHGLLCPTYFSYSRRKSSRGMDACERIVRRVLDFSVR